MKTLQRRRLGVESLEQRRCLAATALVSGGSLNILSDVPVDLAVTQTGATTWEVTDGGAPLGAGTFTGVTNHLIIKTSAADDQIDIDLNGFSLPKTLYLRAGAGENNISIHGGAVGVLDIAAGEDADTFALDNLTIKGYAQIITGQGDNTLDITESEFRNRTSIITGGGDDTVTLGDGAAPVVFRGSVLVRDKGGPLDSLTVRDQVVFQGSLQTCVVNEVNLEAGSEVRGHLIFTGGAGVPNDLTVEGSVGGSLWFYGNSQTDRLNLTATSSLGGNLNAWLRAGDDEVTLAGDILGSVGIDGQNGDDTIDFGGFVGGKAKVLLGSGDDFLDFNGQIGLAPTNVTRLQIDGGAGNDRIALRAASEVNGNVYATLGIGDDEFGLDDLAVIVSAALNGGAGVDTYYGTPARPNVTRTLFEILGGPVTPY
jgi:hypothetical protein